MDAGELTWQRWVVKALGSLMIHAGQLSNLPDASIPDASIMLDNLRVCVDYLSQGSKRAFVFRLGMRESTMLTEYLRGKKQMSIDSILQLCHGLGVTPFELITQVWSQDTVATLNLSMSAPKPLARARPVSLNQAEQLLQQALKDNLTATAVKTLTSFRQVIIITRLSRLYLEKSFPKLTRQLINQYRKRHRELGQAQCKEDCRHIRQAVFDLHRAGQYPSYSRACRLAGLVRGNAKTLAAWQQAKKECGYRILDDPVK